MSEDRFGAQYQPMSDEELAELAEAWRALQAELATRARKPDVRHSADPPVGVDPFYRLVGDRLSAEDTPFRRTLSPFFWLAVLLVGLAFGVISVQQRALGDNASVIISFLCLGGSGFCLSWMDRNLCDVFLVNDALDVKGRHGLSHIPLHSVHSIEDGNRWPLDRTVLL